MHHVNSPVPRIMAVACAAVCLLLLVVDGAFQSARAQQAQGSVVLLTVEGAIGPATADYVGRGLDSAAERGAELALVRIDTPGGLDSAMRDIVKAVTGSPVPVAVYVAPTGARAASAGTYILYAAHIAAMAPGTNLGAATPVQIGGSPPKLPSVSDDEDRDAGADADDAGRRKLVNDAVAYLRGFAELRGRNPDWAEQAVREGVSLPATEALAAGAIEFVANSNSDLLRQIDGTRVDTVLGERVLATANADIESYESDWRNRLLAVIANPNVAYILMLIGIYGLIFEFANPGAIVPGTVGAICLLLALYALQLLPVNYAGMALLLLGIGLMIAEAFQPSFGVLGIGGIIAFVGGSVILIETEAPGFSIAMPVIATFTAASALVFVFIVGMAIKARRRPVVSGIEQLVGAAATVVEDFDGEGRVRTHSETWRAVAAVPLRQGQTVRVRRVDGLTLLVEPMDDENEEAS